MQPYRSFSILRRMAHVLEEERSWSAAGDGIDADDLRQLLEAVKAALDTQDPRVYAADLEAFSEGSAL